MEQRGSSPDAKCAPDPNHPGGGGALGSAGTARCNAKRSVRCCSERRPLMSAPRTINDHTIPFADERTPHSPFAPVTTGQCRNQTSVNSTVPTLKNYAPTPRHFSSISIVLHDWAADRRALLSDAANHADRLASCSDLGSVCTLAMEDRQKNQACTFCTASIAIDRCTPCRLGAVSHDERREE